MEKGLYSMRNLKFVLYEVFDVVGLSNHGRFKLHTRETYDMLLDVSEKIAAEHLRNHLRESDRNPPRLINGQVTVLRDLHYYYRAFCDAGLLSATFDERYSGFSLPNTVFAAADFIIGNAHNGFEMFTSLSKGAARLIESFGSAAVKETYLSKILEGQWTATMCLTESQAGSSLSNITTTAYPQQDGSYNIRGHKIFISAGDHDITENIVHLALVRIQGAPPGTRGISLFVIPKKRPVHGQLMPNDVTSVAMYHKMGQRSTPAMHLEFGTNDDCKGFLVGEPHKGLAYMFQMMNSFRVGIGLAGSYIATAAYYASLQYAKERKQGRRPGDSESAGQTPIINHPDVRRMLFLQKAIAEGTFSLVMQCNLYADLESVSKDAERQRYRDLQELLTPVAKAYGSEMGIVSVNAGLQVLGGYGYTDDFILEQLARDVRIMTLYEGTTGIQAQALLGRQIPANDGKAFGLLKEEIRTTIDNSTTKELAPYGEWLNTEVDLLEKTTTMLLERRADPEIFLMDANLYMELFGIVCVAWQWLRQALVAGRALQKSHGNDSIFYRSKIDTMKFFFHYELVKTRSLHAKLGDKLALTPVRDIETLI
jgi:butyryl-CoA dehydrogenase